MGGAGGNSSRYLLGNTTVVTYTSRTRPSYVAASSPCVMTLRWLATPDGDMPTTRLPTEIAFFAFRTQARAYASYTPLALGRTPLRTLDWFHVTPITCYVTHTAARLSYGPCALVRYCPLLSAIVRFCSRATRPHRDRSRQVALDLRRPHQIILTTRHSLALLSI